jgi:protein-L-isoaspartate(D-aspartate) O-methyltransferase
VWDVPAAWLGQLAPDGRLVVPLLIRGLPRSWALDRQDSHLVSRSSLPAYFVPMRGAAGQYREWTVPVDEGVTLWGEGPKPADLDRAALAAVLAAERCEARTGVTLPIGKPATGLDLWLVTGPGQCWLNVSKDDALARCLPTPLGLIARSGRTDAPALASGGSLAYYGSRQLVDETRAAVEFLVHGHGPHGADLAERLAAHLQAWDRDHRAGLAPILTVHPADTPATALPTGYVLNQRHSTFVLSWREAGQRRPPKLSCIKRPGKRAQSIHVNLIFAGRR